MGVEFIWNQSWLIFTISCCLLLVIIFLLLCCLCWERKDNTMHHFYILDENGLKRSKISKVPKNKSRLNMFRRFSDAMNDKSKSETNIHENAVFTSANLPFMNKGKTESVLGDQDEYASLFDKSVLQLNNSRENSDDEEAHSCVSTLTADSKKTFYSIYPRRSSKADTFVSVDFEVDKLLNR